MAKTKKSAFETYYYQHDRMLTHKVVDYHKDNIERHSDWLQNGVDAAADVEFVTVWEDTAGNKLPVRTELYAFMQDLKSSMGNIEFALTSNGLNSRNGASFIEKFVVYRPDDVYALGTVAFQDPVALASRRSYGEYRDPTYIITSPYIQNPRYREGNPGYTARTYKHKEAALRGAKKELRSYAPFDIALIDRDKFETEVSTGTSHARHELRDARYALEQRVDKLAEELYALHTGTASIIHSSEVLEAIENFRSRQDKFNEELSRPRKGMFVVVRQSGSAVALEFSTTPSKSSGTQGVSLSKIPTIYTSVDELPEDVQGKIAALSMLGGNEYVEDVGMVRHGSTFWVEL